MLLTAAFPRFDASRLAFAAAVTVLAAGPIIWLINTWLDPAFDSYGFWYFCVFAALAAWSATSPLTRAANSADERIAIALLAATALVRLTGQVLAIDTIGALALALDVYALAQLAGLNRRLRAVSPFWLAVAFAFALPLERIVQRSIGYLLQDISAQGACGALSALFGNVQCAGVRITVEGADVLVDLPCSGARSMILFAFAFTISAALARPNWRWAMLGGALAFAAALAGNILRITLLASGVALGPEQLGFDVMAQPWHDLVGLVALAAVAPVLVLWARRVPTPQAAPQAFRWEEAPRTAHGAWRACVFLLVAIAVVIAPRRPADVAARDVMITAPQRIGAAQAIALPLTDRERLYFEQYGGAAVIRLAGMGLSAVRVALRRLGRCRRADRLYRNASRPAFSLLAPEQDGSQRRTRNRGDDAAK